MAAMQEVNMMMVHVDMPSLVSIQQGFNDALWQVTGTPEVVLLVNGQSAPTVTVNPGTWYRWRIAYASIEDGVTLSFAAGTTSCELQLLAKDGIYLEVRCPAGHALPRSLNLYQSHALAFSTLCSAALFRRHRAPFPIFPSIRDTAQMWRYGARVRGRPRSK